MRPCYTLNCRERRLDLGAHTVIMGIMNVTPDSFSGDGLLKQKAVNLSVVLVQARRLIKAGAAIIDVGGESTRPGAAPVSVKEEIRRVVPVIKALSTTTDAVVSIDSIKPEVIEAALDAGAGMVNLVKGTPPSGRILRLVKRYHAAIVLMHMRGTPATMQRYTQYRNVVRDVLGELKKSVEKCCETGITKDRIIVDPGICFAKTVEQNFVLIRELAEFLKLGCPLLIGPSRKSFIGKTLGVEDPHKRVFGTAAAVTAAILKGAHIIRVHDVFEMRQIAQITDAVLNMQDAQI